MRRLIALAGVLLLAFLLMGAQVAKTAVRQVRGCYQS